MTRRITPLNRSGPPAFATTALAGACALMLGSQPLSAKPRSDFDAEVTASAVAASDRSVDEEGDYSRSGLILRGSASYERRNGPTELRLEYDTGVYLYESDERSNRWSNAVEVGLDQRMAQDLHFGATVSYASNIAVLEYRSADQSQVGGSIAYSPGDHRITLSGGWRWRDYDNRDRTEGAGPFAELEYRLRLGRNRYVSTEIGYEDIDSADSRRGYERTTAQVLFQEPLSANWRLRASVRARQWTFDGRTAPSGARRRDTSVRPVIELRRYWDNGLLLRGRAQYDFRSSNDPEFAGDEQQVILTGGYRF
ncbi:hypothetical protein N0B51_10210 [Tsuneonella sp. YG55]|uniref:DUF560 domain-containing protein n=1 Tax=Tsuneonella litorea TaxID=2976475 RepID=A0A9X3A8D3_9SPHN|nr:hypothetical protein [Tsuneonella litorea]MCT2559351.1 hypothetical protein [Tsuneonella litorea]